MKVKMDFTELKDAVTAAGKAIKKGTPVIPLVRLKAKDDMLSLSVSGTIDVLIRIPCIVQEPGEFTAAFCDLNLLSIRKCTGDITICSNGEKALLLNYKNGQANTVLPMAETPFNSFPVWNEKAQKVNLPLPSLNRMVKETVPFTDENTSSGLHAVRLDIADDTEDGILRIQLQTCNRRSFASRTAYAVKNGTHTGSVLLLPEDLKTALDVINDDNGDVCLICDGERVFLKHGNTVAVLRILGTKFPDLNAMISGMEKSLFSVRIDKREFIETLNCAVYVWNAARSQNETDASAAIRFSNHELRISSDGLASYDERIDAETSGKLPGFMLFDVRLLKSLVSIYPDEVLEITGTTEKAPLWMCHGENGEYVYCILPRVR